MDKVKPYHRLFITKEFMGFGFMFEPNPPICEINYKYSIYINLIFIRYFLKW